MSEKAAEQPTALELQILKILWDTSSLTAREVRAALSKVGRDLAHTSVITTLQKMVAKTQLKQLAPIAGKAFRFEPCVTEERVSQGMLGDIVDRVFDGSAEAVMLSLFDVSDLDADSLKRLRRIFNEKMREKQS